VTALDPASWSLYLDLADLAAEDGDFDDAAALATQGEEFEPHNIATGHQGLRYSQDRNALMERTFSHVATASTRALSCVDEPRDQSSKTPKPRRASLSST
jgi:hypothetical protein